MGLTNRAKMSDNELMKGNEFIRKIKRLAKKRGIEAYVDKKRGKGSHLTLYVGERLTIVRNPSQELKTGTIKAMLKQLGLEENDII